MQMNLVTCLHIVSYLGGGYIIRTLGGTKKLFCCVCWVPQKMRLHPQKVQYGNFRFVMEEMTSFVFCQVPWENEYESSIVCFYSSGQQLLYQDRPFSYKKRPIEVYHLMATSHIIWVNFAK